MNDFELEKLRRKRWVHLSKLLAGREKKKEVNVKAILNKIFTGRAWEVFNALQNQHPQVAQKISSVLIDLSSSGKINQVSGQELFFLLRELGLKIKLKTKIIIKEHGKLKSFKEKMKE